MTQQEFISFSQRIRGRLTALAGRFNKAAGWEGDAEDIVQDALVTLWELSVKGYPIRDAEALAVKITKTCCVEKYRKQHVRYVPIGEQPLPGGYSATLGTDRMDLETILSIIRKDLSPSELKLLELRNGIGLTLDEMAAATGRPKSSIKAALSAARHKMMEKLKRMK